MSVVEFVWNQEEHQNMGAWTFVRPRFENLVGCRVRYSTVETIMTIFKHLKLYLQNICINGKFSKRKMQKIILPSDF